MPAHMVPMPAADARIASTVSSSVVAPANRSVSSRSRRMRRVACTATFWMRCARWRSSRNRSSAVHDAARSASVARSVELQGWGSESRAQTVPTGMPLRSKIGKPAYAPMPSSVTVAVRDRRGSARRSSTTSGRPMLMVVPHSGSVRVVRRVAWNGSGRPSAPGYT